MRINDITRDILLQCADDAVNYPNLNHSGDIELALNVINALTKHLSMTIFDEEQNVYDEEIALSREYDKSEIIQALEKIYIVGSSMYIDCWIEQNYNHYEPRR